MFPTDFPGFFFAESITKNIFDLLSPIIGVMVGWYWSRWQANSAWHRKEFKTVILLSLNHITQQHTTDAQSPQFSLKLRSLFERAINAVFPNQAMLDLVHSGIECTTPNDPLVRLPKEDGWFILNRILNEIAEQFAEGTLKKNMGLDCLTKTYLFCLTFERDGRMDQFKPRILLFEKEAFLNFPQEGEIQLESQRHQIRVNTIRLLQQEYQKSPEHFREMEIIL